MLKWLLPLLFLFFSSYSFAEDVDQCFVVKQVVHMYNWWEPSYGHFNSSHYWFCMTGFLSNGSSLYQYPYYISIGNIAPLRGVWINHFNVCHWSDGSASSCYWDLHDPTYHYSFQHKLCTDYGGRYGFCGSFAQFIASLAVLGPSDKARILSFVNSNPGINDFYYVIPCFDLNPSNTFRYHFSPYGGSGCLQCKADLALAKTRITSEASSILTLYNNSYQGFTKLLPCNSLICLSDYPSYFSAIANSVPILGLFAATMIVFRRKRQPRKTQGK